MFYSLSLLTMTESDTRYEQIMQYLKKVNLVDPLSNCML